MSREPARWPDWVEEWVMPYLDNRALWPVWFALIGHVVVGVAGLVLVGVRSSLPEAWVAVALLGLGSAWLVQREWRVAGSLAGVTLTVGLTWAAALGLAGLAEATGLF